jgi:hypothetical protein
MLFPMIGIESEAPRVSGSHSTRLKFELADSCSRRWGTVMRYYLASVSDRQRTHPMPGLFSVNGITSLLVTLVALLVTMKS